MKKNASILLCCVLTLAALGAVMVFSVISARASTVGVGVKYLLKHLLWAVIGLTGMTLAARFDYRKLQRRWPLIAGIALLLLVAVRVPGIGTCKNGAWRWIRFGPVGFQPSECAKMAVIVTVAVLLTRRKTELMTLKRDVLAPMAVVAGAMALIVVEPDFGTAALVAGVGTLMVLASGAPVWPLAAASAAGAGGLGFLIWRSPTRLARVFAFLDPWKHQDRAGYQVVHSLISLGSGGLAGRGLGASRQKLFYLPESDSDFILAVIGEELGLIGTLAVIVVFLLIVRQGMAISERASDPFGAFLAFGITMMIGLQALIHIAVVTASMPTKGIALPFVSSGGSSMVVSMTAVGVLLSIAARAQAPGTVPQADAGVGRPAIGAAD